MNWWMLAAIVELVIIVLLQILVVWFIRNNLAVNKILDDALAETRQFGRKLGQYERSRVHVD